MQDVVPAVYFIDKPVGPTSFRMVQLVKRALQIKKVGHAGTLDPFASGLLIVCVGRAATKHISKLMEGDKEYSATLKLGIETDSQDCTGVVTFENDVPDLSWKEVEDCLGRFVGEQLQHPPQFSALKYKGKPLYYYARKGIKVEKPPRKIIIRELELCGLQDDLLQIRVVCSKGTYIRTLAADIGTALGSGAHLTELRRLRSGSFSVATALAGEKLDQDRQEAREVLLENMHAVEDILAKISAEKIELSVV